MIRLRFGGNGHTRGYNSGGTPGQVTVYWKGGPEQEITDISEFTAQNTLQTQGFSDDSFSYPADPKVISPSEGLVDKGNWMELKLPSAMQPGRHMMAWVWSFENGPQFTTCFDVMIEGAPGGSSVQVVSSSSAPSSAAQPASSPAISAVATEQTVIIPVSGVSTSSESPDTPGSSSPSTPSSSSPAVSSSTALQVAPIAVEYTSVTSTVFPNSTAVASNSTVMPESNVLLQVTSSGSSVRPMWIWRILGGMNRPRRFRLAL
jgi:hypothetical protein